MAQSLVLPRSHTGAGGVAYKLGTLDFWWRAEGIFLHGVVSNGVVAGRVGALHPVEDHGLLRHRHSSDRLRVGLSGPGTLNALQLEHHLLIRHDIRQYRLHQLRLRGALLI